MTGQDMPGPRGVGRWAFLRTPRWLGLMAVSVLAALTCVWLGTWQLDRHEEKVERRDAVEQAEAAAPVPAEEHVGDLLVDESDTWRYVTVTGEWVEGTTLGLRNRPVEGTPAVHVVDLFATELGGQEVVLPVDRGWLPSEVDMTPADLPRPPDGEATLTVRLRPAEHGSTREPAPGWLYSIEEDALRRSLAALTDPAPGAIAVADGGVGVVSGFGELIDSEPAAADGLSGLPRPDVSLRNHLSYAFQWFVFAIGSLAIVPLLARREVDEADEELLAGTPYARGGALSARAGKKVSDAEEEDAWLDAAESAEGAGAGAGVTADDQGASPDQDGCPDQTAQAGGQASVTSSR
ncbi:SURF1 family protein [Georgenia sp. Z1344]|uniref:SURF1 family protein n=1 Tax=Georgenia sp. Z1344 TaxID=3416706 RepID=UPI003CFAB63B